MSEEQRIQPGSAEEKALMEGPVSGLPRPMMPELTEELDVKELASRIREYAITRIGYGEQWWEQVLPENLDTEDLEQFLQDEQCKTMREAIAAFTAELGPQED